MRNLTGPIDWRRCLRLGLVGAALSAAVVMLAIVASPDPAADETEGGYTLPYTPPTNRFEILLNHGDGQAYATLAQDPGFSRPDDFVGGAEASVQFASRPLYPLLLWGLSGGQPDLLPMSFVFLGGVGGGLLVFAGAAVLHASQRSDVDRLAFGPMLFPGWWSTVAALELDVFALGLALLAFVLWMVSRRAGLATLLFVLAAMTRETTLVMPAVVIVYDLVRRDLRRAHLLLLLPFLAWGSWSLMLSARYGVGSEGGLARQIHSPLVALVERYPDWPIVGQVMVPLFIVFILAALLRPTVVELQYLLVPYALFILIIGAPGWERWDTGLRLALPAAVIALLDIRLGAVLERGLRSTPASGP